MGFTTKTPIHEGITKKMIHGMIRDGRRVMMKDKTRSIVKWIFAFLLCFFHNCIAHAQAQYVGPNGGIVTAVVPDRNNPQVWYSINNENLYRSTDQGRHWSLKLT